MPARRCHIALLIESSRASGRGLLHGIAKYARTHGPWSVYHHERSLGDAAPVSLFDWKPDGIIARLESRRLLEQIAKMNVPTVDVLGWHPRNGIPAFGNNRGKVVRMAVDHLSERGFRHFAYCGFPGLEYSRQRGELFAAYLEELGGRPYLFKIPRSTPVNTTAKVEAKGLLHNKALASWLTTLPKPVGLVACNDTRAQQVLTVCIENGIKVPDEVAVVGVDNDELLCEFCNPPLSSVALNNEKIGFEAATTLDAMMQGRKVPLEKTLVAPLGVVARQSTDVLAIEDSDVVEALRFIREHACDGIAVEDVVRHVAVSSSTLKRRFSALLGRSPKSEILRVQMERVKQFLAMTNLPLATIAERSGFHHVECLCKLFKKKTGKTPGQYRREIQA